MNSESFRGVCSLPLAAQPTIISRCSDVTGCGCEWQDGSPLLVASGYSTGSRAAPVARVTSDWSAGDSAPKARGKPGVVQPVKAVRFFRLPAFVVITYGVRVCVKF